MTKFTLIVFLRIDILRSDSQLNCSAGMISSGSGGNFTDYAQRGPPDALRGATSYPINANHRTAYAYTQLYGGDGQDSEAGQMQQSPPNDRNQLLMKRSQSLALPANMVLEVNGQSASNCNPYKRAELRSHRPLHAASDDDGELGMLQSQLQQQYHQKADKGVPRRRITSQNIEPSKAAWLAQNALKEGIGGLSADSPRVGSGLIKVGLGQGFEEDGRNRC